MWTTSGVAAGERPEIGAGNAQFSGYTKDLHIEGSYRQHAVLQAGMGIGDTREFY